MQEYLPWLWIGFGILLVILEIFVPGAVIIFFGIGAILTGLAVWLDLIVEIWQQFLFWAFSSMVLVLLLRGQVARWFPAFESYDYQNEQDQIQGTIVAVLKDVEPGNDAGRVRFRGTSWQARSTGPTIYSGERARIVERINLVLLVEPLNSGTQMSLPPEH